MPLLALRATRRSYRILVEPWLSAPEHLIIYTDGSRRIYGGRKRVGAGVVAYRMGREVDSFVRGLADGADDYDGEVAALELAALFAVNYVKDYPRVHHIHFFSDHMSAVEAVFSLKGSRIFYECICAALDGDKGLEVDLAWCPGHKAIVGNQRADSLAKIASAETFWTPPGTR
ncbi:ribonuclease H-like domain-containing protein [Schizophyllum amplum]|uniref:Ribonuclease H-like domain-containing protein n=1 Tax=Schizophyllum amplum TaxID=97359 RepID=A0A550CYM2_9AGAR|nr:ribonuclease H-like domain-containing protein [Auriculariopsis ampla]